MSDGRIAHFAADNRQGRRAAQLSRDRRTTDDS
jgi:hypothetical protein